MVTLRILTRKSKLGFGPYANETIEMLLNRHMYPYLRKVYYTYEAISFQDDILDEIHAEIRIEKPGTNKEAIEIVSEKLFNKRFHALKKAGFEKKALGELTRRKADQRHKERRERNLRRNE